jgi:hypothetical protein
VTGLELVTVDDGDWDDEWDDVWAGWGPTRVTGLELVNLPTGLEHG